MGSHAGAYLNGQPCWSLSKWAALLEPVQMGSHAGAFQMGSHAGAFQMGSLAGAFQMGSHAGACPNEQPCLSLSKWAAMLEPVQMGSHAGALPSLVAYTNCLHKVWK